MGRPWFGKEKPEEPADDEDLVFIPVPSLISILIAQEDEKGAALTEQEVLRTADDCIGVAVKPSMAASMADSRGYNEIDLDDVWADWKCHVAARDRDQVDRGDTPAPATTSVTMTGDIEVFLRALGKPPDHPMYKAAATHAGSIVEMEDFPDGSRYWSFSDGVEFLIEGKNLSSVFLRLRPDPSVGDYVVYPRAGTLIAGMSSRPDRDEVTELFGAPGGEFHASFGNGEVSGVRYEVSARFVHFTFDQDGRVELITLMSSAVG